MSTRLYYVIGIGETFWAVFGIWSIFGTVLGIEHLPPPPPQF